ncbi:hypothetical protein EEB14_56270 [Rhodococcus sp. WS4]|nr:hypothetical protein EEB14_56270 [Rhodococcus sp. WS4]
MSPEAQWWPTNAVPPAFFSVPSGRHDTDRYQLGAGWVRERPHRAADLERELAMLASVRDRLRASEGADFRIPTTAVDQVLDELSGLESLPGDPT